MSLGKIICKHYTSRLSEVFCKKVVFKNLCQSLFFNKAADLSDSDTGVFLWILRNF